MSGVSLVVLVASVIAICVIAPNGQLGSRRGLVNTSAVIVMMLLIHAAGALVHNRAVDRR